jgi:hypothetical protein
MAIDSQGYQHICYVECADDNYLKYTSWTGSSWDIKILAPIGGWGGDCSLALNSLDQPCIICFNSTADSLNYA